LEYGKDQDTPLSDEALNSYLTDFKKAIEAAVFALPIKKRSDILKSPYCHHTFEEVTTR
jgi:hypothetical protein